MYSGLENLNKELQAAAADTALSQERRTLALTLLDEISTCLFPGFVPSTKPTDGWLASDVISQQTQIEMWTFTQLQSRWFVPVKIWEIKPSSPVTEPAQVEIEDVF
jgi:hypothetical protein